MNHEQLRAAVIKKLRESNWLISEKANNQTIGQGIKAVTGKNRPAKTDLISYMRKFIGLDIDPEPEVDPNPFVPQKATAPNWASEKNTGRPCISGTMSSASRSGLLLCRVQALVGIVEWGGAGNDRS